MEKTRLLTKEARFLVSSIYMRRNLSVFFILCGLLLLPSVVLAQKKINSFGIIKSTIWYSKDPFFAGDSVRIYSGLFNGSDQDITGVAGFYVNNILVGSRDFSLPGGGVFEHIWADWLAFPGEHTVSVKITSAVIDPKIGESTPILLADLFTATDTVFVDIDTDKDLIGDMEDPDDDNDGILDEDDPEPLIATIINSPKEQAKAKEKSLVEDIFAQGISQVSSPAAANVLESVAGVAVSGYNVVSDFAQKQEVGLRERVTAVEQEIARLKTEEVFVTGVDTHLDQINEAAGVTAFDSKQKKFDLSSFLLRIGNQLYRLFLKLMILIFSYEIILHLLIAHVLYKLIRWFIRLVRRPSY